MATVTLTSKRQTTIPKEICLHLHVRPGDRLRFVIEEDGRVVLLPVTVKISELKGILPPPRKRVTVEDMKRAIREGGGRL